jgi:glycosyltransferase involved in cell wall biosynthesis
LSFVIPAYNEENFIESTLGALDEVVKNQMLPYEIVVVDDGSKDETLAKAMKYAKRNGHVKVVGYVRNMGKGYAVKEGFMQASGEIVVFADSDLEIDLSTISRYIAALQYGDIVIASKRHPDSHVEVPLSRKIMSHSFNIIVRLLTGAPLRDTQSGLKAMKKSAFVDIFPRLAVKRYAFDVELLAVAHLYGLKIVEMPVNIKMNASFKLRDVSKMFVDLLGIAYRLRVIHWYQRHLPAKNGLQHFASLVFREN